jgi:hypothetical protein
MISKRHFLAAAAFVALSAASPALADEFLGSYVARISSSDHYASDGYELDTAAQMVRQDRANFHKFGIRDPDDESDPWFRSTASRARFEKMLNKSSAMSGATRNAIANGEPLVEVEVYRNSVKVRIVGY